MNTPTNPETARATPDNGRTQGKTPLHGRPLDDNGAVVLTSGHTVGCLRDSNAENCPICKPINEHTHATHTPTPWTWLTIEDELCDILDHNGYDVANLVPANNAQFIVHACNNIERITAERSELIRRLNLSEEAVRDLTAGRDALREQIQTQESAIREEHARLINERDALLAACKVFRREFWQSRFKTDVRKDFSLLTAEAALGTAIIACRGLDVLAD